MKDKKEEESMDRNKDEKYLMIPYSLEEDRNKKDPRAGYCIEELKNKPFREPLAKFAKAVTTVQRYNLARKISQQKARSTGDFTILLQMSSARSVSRWRSVIQEHLLI